MNPHYFRRTTRQLAGELDGRLGYAEKNLVNSWILWPIYSWTSFCRTADFVSALDRYSLQNASIRSSIRVSTKASTSRHSSG